MQEREGSKKRELSELRLSRIIRHKAEFTREEITGLRIGGGDVVGMKDQTTRREHEVEYCCRDEMKTV